MGGEQYAGVVAVQQRQRDGDREFSGEAFRGEPVDRVRRAIRDGADRDRLVAASAQGRRQRLRRCGWPGELRLRRRTRATVPPARSGGGGERQEQVRSDVVTVRSRVAAE